MSIISSHSLFVSNKITMDKILRSDLVTSMLKTVIFLDTDSTERRFAHSNGKCFAGRLLAILILYKLDQQITRKRYSAFVFGYAFYKSDYGISAK